MIIVGRYPLLTVTEMTKHLEYLGRRDEMLSEKLLDVLKKEGVVSIVSWGRDEPHLVNTWNSYLVVTADERILIPAYAMRKTEKNVIQNNRVKIALGSREVMGFNNYQGTGFAIEGTARFLATGPEFDMMKAKFSFLTRVLEITVKSAKQML
jgi:hypothetical protein